MKYSTLLAAIGVILASATSAKASLAGFTDYSLGGTTAGWDIFYGANYLPVFTFETGTAGNPSNSLDPLTLQAAVPGWMPGPPMPANGQATGPTGTDNQIPGDREQFYTFFANEVDFSITATIGGGSSLNSFVFQALPITGSGGDLTSISLNGMEASSTGTNGSEVQFWSWTGLDLAPGSTVTLTFKAEETHTAIDAFQIQTNSALAAVPEPTTTLLLLGATAGLFLLRRRRSPQS